MKILKILFIFIIIFYLFPNTVIAKKQCGTSSVWCEDYQDCDINLGPPPTPPFRCIDPRIIIGDKYYLPNPVPQFQNLADIINKLLPYAFTLSGILLFLLLLASGFEFLTSAGDEKKLSQAKGRITSALAGFIIIVAAYWLTQIVEFLFHIQIF